MPELHVLIIAENPLARMGLAALLANHPDIVIVGQSGGAQVAAEAEMSNPDVLIVDWNENTAPDLPAGYPLLALLKDEGQAAEAWAAG
ncbi:MAG: response regulator transcription factor, partial [Anaerolineae bacterium]|nr:response regulator transcription factor [Anaerolineae bacterium]